MVTADAIDALLPQTQCGECGYPGCLPYAKALAEGLAPIDRCPPGGARVLIRLGQLLQVDPAPYLDGISARTRPPAVALIREEECIGCTKCIQACPVDAIVGTGKWMHSVLSHECTGCGLCVEPCPVDCIELKPLDAPQYEPHKARQRFYARQMRILQETSLMEQQSSVQRGEIPADQSIESAERPDLVEDKKAKQAYILQALQRVRAKKTS